MAVMKHNLGDKSNQALQNLYRVALTRWQTAPYAAGPGALQDDNDMTTSPELCPA